MNNDPFKYLSDSPIAPAERCFAITPDDANDLPVTTKAVYIGDAGDVNLVSLHGVGEVIFRNLAAGTILDVRVKAVRASGTTAASLVGLY